MKLFLDESGNDGHSRAFLVGGWMFRDDRTAAFEASWHEALAREPAIGYCKHSDAKGRSGPFEGWLPEDIEAKLFQLADVICQHASGGVVSIFPHKLFEYLISELTIPKKKRQSIIPDIDPYALSVHNVIASALQVHRERGGDDRIDFVFDSGQEALIQCINRFDEVKQLLPTALRGLAGTVSIANDHDAPGLQAADMLVGQFAMNARHGKPEQLLQRLSQCLPVAFNKIEAEHLAIFAKTLHDLNIVWSLKVLFDRERKGPQERH